MKRKQKVLLLENLFLIVYNWFIQSIFSIRKKINQIFACLKYAMQFPLKQLAIIKWPYFILLYNIFYIAQCFF